MSPSRLISVAPVVARAVVPSIRVRLLVSRVLQVVRVPPIVLVPVMATALGSVVTCLLIVKTPPLSVLIWQFRKLQVTPPPVVVLSKLSGALLITLSQQLGASIIQHPELEIGVANKSSLKLERLEVVNLRASIILLVSPVLMSLPQTWVTKAVLLLLPSKNPKANRPLVRPAVSSVAPASIGVVSL